MPTRTVLDAFDVSLEFLSRVVFDNPSLRGMIVGYLAEAKLREILTVDGKATDFDKHDDHDRKKKGDLVMKYQGLDLKVEVKSLQTNTVEILEPGTTPEKWVRKILKQSGRGVPNPDFIPTWERERLSDSVQFRGQFQCDASDSRPVIFPDGSKVKTTDLLFGEFDIVAAGLFAFREKWDFAFALNRDLPKSTHQAYTAHQRDNLIASMVPITWPVKPPFTTDLYGLLDKLVGEATQRAASPQTTAPAVAVIEASATGEAHPKSKKRKKKV
jgi:hypothetical protein